METGNQEQERHLSKSQEQSLTTSKLTPQEVARHLARISRSFPALNEAFFYVLLEFAEKQGMTDERLKAAIDHVIATSIYPQPTIAQFLVYDKEIQEGIRQKERSKLVQKIEANAKNYFKKGGKDV